MLRQLKPAILLLVAMTILTGALYPLAITLAAQLLFPRQANGSLIVERGRVVGSALLGQNFTDPKYFWSRPSATSPFPYNAAASSGSNLGPLNPDLAREHRDSPRRVAGRGSGSASTGSARSAGVLSQRTRSAYQSGSCRVPGGPSRARTKPSPPAGPRSHPAKHARTAVGIPGRTNRERRRVKLGPRSATLSRKKRLGRIDKVATWNPPGLARTKYSSA